MRIELMRGKDPSTALTSVATNSDGRTDSPLLEGAELTADTYRLVFHVGDYFRRRDDPDAGRFLEDVPIVFVIEDPAGKYHVPLLVSPWSYSTYRGS
jgi:5-hydroxyisourate hydrolase/2-oxo-4-hydroxy-4-carboxy-5-ureidoimidazoline decarboxylase